ncbi:helix-turn-helix transcriptional regulator [Synergistaceae bacterium OttesenSCG-928-I11]|nr:helix-turn-helix transcriptional regulator [Synergistaceae bacterium OttesenSCG-928-I11]
MSRKKNFNPALRAYLPIVDCIANVVGPDCEVLLHDVSTPESSVVACRNAHITGRAVGAPMTPFGRQLMQSEMHSGTGGIYNYPATTEDGKKLKCSVVFLRDETGALIGILCVNVDITRAEQAKRLLDDFVRADGDVLGTRAQGAKRVERDEDRDDAPQIPREVFYRDLDDVWDHLLEEAKRTSPVPLTHLSPPEIERLIERLEEDGFFLVKGSINVLAKEIGKSRYTIYGYLRRIRTRKAKKNEPPPRAF